MASLKMIAERTNLSRATVSRALSNHKDVSEETRQRVMDIANELQYRPNLLARSMHTGKTGLVGVIAPEGAESMGEFYIRLIYGVQKELNRQGYIPIHLWTGTAYQPDDDHAVASQIHQLIDRRVEGVVIIPTVDSRETYLSEILNRHIPMVLLDIELEDLNADFVGTDDYYGAVLITNYLVKLGHRRITYFGGTATSSTAILRGRAYETVMAGIGAEPHGVEDPFYGTDMRVNLALARKILSAPNRPTAVFCGSDVMACGIYKAARQLHLDIPRDLSVVGFGDLTIAQLLDPSLTTVRINPNELGAQAARLLILRSQYKDQDVNLVPQKVFLKPELIIRESATQYNGGRMR